VIERIIYKKQTKDSKFKTKNNRIELVWVRTRKKI